MGADGLYFRVSSERQTSENQFDDLLQVAEKDGSGRDWAKYPDSELRWRIPGASGRGGQSAGFEALHEGGKVSPCKSPAKGGGGFLVAILEGK